MSDAFDLVRVVDEQTAIMLTGVSPRTWDRLRARGEAPPATRFRSGALVTASSI
jgi:hypothetical protein